MNSSYLRDAGELAEFVRTMSSFVIHTSIEGDYHHLGATLANALLQVNHSAVARPLVHRILDSYPDARTSGSILRLLNSIDVMEYLALDDVELADCFRRALQLFADEGIESEADLHAWLMAGGSLWKLRSIKGVGPQTVDYLKVLVGVTCRTVGRHLLNFLGLAGLAPGSDDEARAVLNGAANLLSITPACFDYSIWRFMNQRAAGLEASKLGAGPQFPVIRPPEAKVIEHGARAGTIAFALVLMAGGAFYYLNNGNQTHEYSGQQKASKVKLPSRMDTMPAMAAKSEIPAAILTELAAGGQAPERKPGLPNPRPEPRRRSAAAVNFDACRDQYFAPDDYDQEHPGLRPYKELAKLLREAKDKNATAQRILASYYEHGYLVAQCEEKAAYWYQSAAAGGDESAARWLRKQEQLEFMHNSPECAGVACDVYFQKAGMAVSMRTEQIPTVPDPSPTAPGRTARNDATMAMLRNTLDEHSL